MTLKPNRDGGPAFPYSIHMEGFDRMAASGMSKREWFAGQALSGLIVGCAGILGREKDGRPHFSAYAKGSCNWVLANRAYAVADAMLREQAATRSDDRMMAMGAALQRLLSVAEDYEHDEFIADACAEARVALGQSADHIEQVGAANEQATLASAEGRKP